jgi:uncharacterized membrane protein
MFSHGVVLVFRLLHIVSGVFWVGGILFLARFLFPTARALGPAAGPVMDHLMRVMKVPQALLGAGVLAVLSGIGLYWSDSLGFKGEWMRSSTGMVFGTGGLLAIIALAIGATVNAPAGKRMAALAAEIQAQKGPPSPAQASEMQRLQGRIGLALRVVTVLLLLAVAAMALARYIA